MQYFIPYIYPIGSVLGLTLGSYICIHLLTWFSDVWPLPFGVIHFRNMFLFRSSVALPFLALRLRLLPVEGAAQQEGLPQEVVGKLVERVATQFGRYPRRAGAGPGGSRYEHWDGLKHCEETSKVLAKTLLRLVTGEVPEQVQDAFLVARLNGIWKADKKGVRVLGCGA